MNSIKTLTEIIVQDIPFSIVRNSLPGRSDGKGKGKEDDDDKKQPSAYQVLENPQNLNKFAENKANNALKSLQKKLRAKTDDVLSNPGEYFKPSNIKKRIEKYAKKDGKPLHVYLTKLFQLFLGLAMFAFFASIFYKLFALIFLGLYLFMLVISFFAIHLFFYGLYSILCAIVNTETLNLKDGFQTGIRFTSEEVGDGSYSGTDSQSMKSDWNNAVADVHNAYDNITEFVSSVYGFTENKVYSYDLGQENINKYNKLNVWWRFIMPTMEQVTFDDVIGVDGKTVENKIKVVDLSEINEEMNKIKDEFLSFRRLTYKLDNIELGKIQQVGGSSQTSSESSVQKASMTSIQDQLQSKIDRLYELKKKIEDIKTTENPDEIHYASLASNEYWQYILKFLPIKFIISIIHVYGNLPYSAYYSVQKLIRAGTKVADVENPLEENKKEKPIGNNGIEILYNKNSESTIDTLTLLFTWLSLLCSYLAKGYLAAAILMLLLSIVNGGAASVWKAAIETVLSTIVPLLKSLGVDIWEFLIKGIFDLAFGGTQAKIRRKTEIEKLNNKFGSGNGKMSSDPNNAIPESNEKNKGTPGTPDKKAEFSGGHLHDLYKKNSKNEFDKEFYNKVKEKLDDLDLNALKSKNGDAKLDEIQEMINKKEKMLFDSWDERAEYLKNK